MLKKSVPYALAAFLAALVVGHSLPAKAEFFGCDDQHPARHVSYSYHHTRSYARAGTYTSAYAAESRPHVTIYPRHRLHRYCRSWLVKEYRLAGTVIVPRVHCWWR
jgi:hypothetical protein